MSSQLIHEELYTYLSQHLENEESIKRQLQNNQMEVFFSETIDNADLSASNLFKKIRFQQYMKELVEIKSIFDKSNILFVVMKGLALAVDLYNKPYQRTFGDIDILILPEQLTIALSLLESIGYKSNEDISAEFFLSELNHEHHFPPLFKNGGMLDAIVLEVHVDIVPGWIFQMRQSYTDKILLRSYVNQFGIPVMDDCDTIIFMMLHLLKHYIYEMLMGTVSGKAEAEIDLHALHEIALFIDKAKNSVSRDALESRASEYGTGNELTLICHMLTDIYPSLADFLKLHIEADSRACFSNRFSHEALKIGTQEILFGDKRRLVCSMINKLQQDAYILPCYKIEDLTNPALARMITINSHHYFNDNRFGTYVDVLNDFLRPECNITFYIEWSMELFWFHMTAKDKEFTFLNCNPETMRQTIGRQDYFRLHFDTGNRDEYQAFVRGILLKPQYDGDNILRLFLKEDIMGNNAETELDQTEYVGLVKYNNGVCKIDVGIPWNRLGYKPGNGFTFFFDVQFWKYYEKYNCHFTLTWQDAYKPWYDIATYACVKLVDNIEE